MCMICVTRERTLRRLGLSNGAVAACQRQAGQPPSEPGRFGRPGLACLDLAGRHEGLADGAVAPEAAQLVE